MIQAYFGINKKNILGRETYTLQGKVDVNHCSQGYRGLARVCTESCSYAGKCASKGEANEKFP